MDRDTYYQHIEQALDAAGPGPDLVIDDGGDLVSTLHTERPALLGLVRGGCEGTTTGVLRLRRMAADGALAFPVIAASDTPVTRIVDNTHGTAQSVLDGLLRASGVLLAGKTVVVAGFGACGSGIAESARALGARIVITEVDPVRALDAVLRGFRVLPIAEAAPIGEVFITATGSTEVITAEHLAVLRDGAILANAGHFDVEIDVRALAAMAVAVHTDVRPHADAYELAGRAPRAAARRRPRGQPRRRRRPPARGDGPRVRHRGPGAPLPGSRGAGGQRRDAAARASTGSPRTSTPRQPGWSSPPSAPGSTRSPRPSSPTRTAGASAPDGFPRARVSFPRASP